MATDWLAAVGTSEESARSGVALHLVRHEDSDIEFCPWSASLYKISDWGMPTFSNMRQL